MEFWGSEIKPGQTVKVEPGEGFVLHLSQATLGESKKGNVPVVLNLKVGEQKFVLGTLSHEKFPQLSFDLVFDDEFELSHNWKNGSVYFVGYKSMLPEEDDDISSYESDSDEEAPQLIPATSLTNGKPEKTGEPADAKAKATKNASSDVPKVGDSDSDEDDDSDNESDEEEENGVDSDEVMQDGESDDESESDEEDDDEDDSDEDDEDEEETPKKVETGKKRPAEPVTQTPSKKGKFTPEIKEGKQAGHTATPHPAKQAKKNPGNKAQPQFPFSNGKKSNKKAKHNIGK